MSKPYFFSRIKLRDDVTLAELRNNGLFDSNEYQNHKHIWKIMSYADNQQRDFIFRTDFDADGMPSFVVCSQNIPQNDNGIWEIESKDYSPKLSTGERLKFFLRCNPTRTENTEIIRKERVGQLPYKKTRRVDVILEERRKSKVNNIEWSNESTELNGGISWLKSHENKLHVIGDKTVLTKCFSINDSSIFVERYTQVLHPKVPNQKVDSLDKFHSAKKFSILDISGVLTVENPTVFTDILLNGIGHGKAFGCGFMTVKRY